MYGSLFLSKCACLQLKVNQKRTPSDAYFRVLTTFLEGLRFRQDFLINEYFRRTTFSGCFCNLHCLGVPNVKSSGLFNFFICLHPTVTKELISWRRSIRLIMLHCTGMGIQQTCDYVVSSFLSIFTHK